MISLIRLAAFLLPVAGSLAAPTSAPVSDVQDAPRKSDAFYEQMRAIINNSTAHEEAELQKRAAGSFSTSQDGVNSAGFYYSLYNDNKAGATYTEYNSGRFALTWNAKAEFLGGKGYKGDTPKTLTWSGPFTASGDYTLAAYGWTTNPVTEWYVVDKHGTGTPGNGKIIGQVNSDGGVYDVYDLYLANVPKIYGATSFHQYWSVRRAARTSGSITIGNHFAGWKSLGLVPGYTVFQMLTLEGFSGSGNLDFTVSYK